MSDLAQRLHRDAAILRDWWSRGRVGDLALATIIQMGEAADALDAADAAELLWEGKDAAWKKIVDRAEQRIKELEEHKALLKEDHDGQMARADAAEEIILAAREHNRTASASSLDQLDGAIRRYDAKWVGTDEVS